MGFSFSKLFAQIPNNITVNWMKLNYITCISWIIARYLGPWYYYAWWLVVCTMACATTSMNPQVFYTCCSLDIDTCNIRLPYNVTWQLPACWQNRNGMLVRPWTDDAQWFILSGELRGMHEVSHRTMATRCRDSKVHGANMGPIWVLPAPDGPHVGPMNLFIRGIVSMA